MSDQIIFPLNEIQTEFLRARNVQATELVQDAVRKVALDVNVPPSVQVAPNESLTALVVVQPPRAAGPPVEETPAPSEPEPDILEPI